MSEISEVFIQDVVRLFSRGIDTAQMAKCHWSKPEFDIERALHIGLERRRADRQADQLAREMVRLADELGANV